MLDTGVEAARGVSPDVRFVPPAPPPRYVPPDAKPSLRGYLRYFQIMTRNPLEIFTERHFNDPIFTSRIFGRSYILVHDPDVIQYYLVANAENYGLTEMRRALFEPVIGKGLLMAQGDLWKRTRRALTPVFTPRHVQGFAPVMLDVAENHVDRLLASAGDTVSMSAQMLRLALDTLVACLFSGDADLDVQRFSGNLERLLRIAGTPHPLDLMGAPKWAPRIGRGEALRIVADLRRQVWTVLQARRKLIAAGGTAPSDFLSLLLTAGVKEGAPLSDEEVIDNLITFLSAGHETTARTLTWTFYLLSQSAGAYARVVEEIDGAALSQTPPEQWLDALPYTAAVLKEGMRLYPAAPVLARVALGPDRLGDIDIAPGTDVITSSWVLHRHRKLWRDPDVFDPSRFFGAAAQEISRFAYIPFGKGPRACIGASFSMQEMMIILAAFLSRLRFTHSGGQDPMPVMRITIQPSTEVEMRVDRR